ncbi:MAG: hypothetical protein WKF96_01215 [Solirubrobacteraceae bacterium]
MSQTTRQHEPVNDDVDTYCWSAHGWECAGEGSVADARRESRGKAAAFFAREVGDIRDVCAWKRYVRPFTLAECWEWYCDERGERDERLSVPNGWYPGEGTPVWEFVRPDHPEAIPVWICGIKGDTPPMKP